MDGRDLVLRPMQEGVLPVSERDPGGGKKAATEGQPQLTFWVGDFSDEISTAWWVNGSNSRSKVSRSIRHYRNGGEEWRMVCFGTYIVQYADRIWYFKWHRA